MPDIRNELSSVTLLDGKTYFFDDEVARLGIGSPLKATTASEMTDTTKIYVYVGEETGYDFGHWYYNNGTAWIDGGVYNSIAVQTDKSLSVPNVPADAFETGELKSILNSMTTATEQDVGKFLKAKTVNAGKVAEWEFSEAGDSTDPKPISKYGLFQNGGLNNGDLYPSWKYRVACAEAILFENESVLLIDPEFRIGVARFDGVNYVGGDGWVRGAYVIPAGSSVKIGIARVSEQTSEIANITEFTSKVKVRTRSVNTGDEIDAINNLTVRPISDLSLFGNGCYSGSSILYDRIYRAFTGRNLIYFPIESRLYIADGYRIEVQFMVDGEYQSSTGWTQSGCVIPAGSYVRIVIARVTEDVTEIADADDFASKVTFFPNAVTILKKVDSFDEKINGIKELQDDSVSSLGLFVRGVLSDGSIATYHQDRVTTESILRIGYDTEFYVDDGFTVLLNFYDDEGTYIRGVSWQTVRFKVPAKTNIRFTISRVSRISGEIANIDEFTAKVKYKKPLMAGIKTFNVDDTQFDRLLNLDSATIDTYGSFSNGRVVDGDSYLRRQEYRYRISSEEFIRFDFEATLHIATGYRIVVHYYVDGVYSRSEGWIQGTYTIPSGSEVMIMIARINETSDEANINEFTSAVTVYSKLLSAITEGAQYHCTGETLNVKHQGYNVELLYNMPSRPSGGFPQGLAIHNGVIAQLYSDNLIQLINLADGTLINTMSISSGHGNNCVFSSEYYDANDEFPLLYSDSGTDGIVNVNRITRTETTLIRSILTGDVSQRGNDTTPILDEENGVLWMFGFTARWMQTSNNRMVVSKWSIKDMADLGNNTYQASFIEKFEMPYIGGAVQGAKYLNGRLWAVVENIYEDPQVYTFIYLIDPYKHLIVNTLSEFPIDIKNYESEGMDFVANGDRYDLYLGTTHRYYRITF